MLLYMTLQTACFVDCTDRKPLCHPIPIKSHLIPLILWQCLVQLACTLVKDPWIVVSMKWLASLSLPLSKICSVGHWVPWLASVNYATEWMIWATLYNSFLRWTMLHIAHCLWTILTYDWIYIFNDRKVVGLDTLLNLFINSNSLIHGMYGGSGINERYLGCLVRCRWKMDWVMYFNFCFIPLTVTIYVCPYTLFDDTVMPVMISAYRRV